MNQSQVVALWHDIANQDHGSIFAEARHCIRKRNAFDTLPQPGFVGSGYRHNGLLLLGKNPGNDRGEKMSVGDSEQFKLITNFRNADMSGRAQCFQTLTAQLETSVMPKWMITRKVVMPILSALSLNLNQVAYINLVKFHTQTTSLHKSLFARSWQSVENQLVQLSPSVIVVLGRSTWTEFEKLCSSSESGQPRRYLITRYNGDTRLPIPGEVTELANREKEFLRAVYTRS